MSLPEEERSVRIMELSAIIEKANAELEKLEPKRSFLQEVQIAIDETSAKLLSGEDWGSKGVDLCNLLVAGLNQLNESFDGIVSIQNEGVIVSTGIGRLTYDADSNEWFFV